MAGTPEPQLDAVRRQMLQFTATLESLSGAALGEEKALGSRLEANGHLLPYMDKEGSIQLEPGAESSTVDGSGSQMLLAAAESRAGAEEARASYMLY